ncbi:hypothetical protein Ae201684_013695 [Aphanomyces euteiches]|nr:hypothetical protein Ae201684_013695 [Aphanomyces euteiches]
MNHADVSSEMEQVNQAHTSPERIYSATYSLMAASSVSLHSSSTAGLANEPSFAEPVIENRAVNLKDEKRNKVLHHPMVAKVSTNGREVQCKCGRMVRLNPPWYILKYEQHLSSRNCKKHGNNSRPYLQKVSEVKANTSCPEVFADVNTILKEGHPEETKTQLQEMKFLCATQLKAHPKFSKVAIDGTFVRCVCKTNVVLSEPWNINNFLQHVENAMCVRPKKRQAKHESSCATESNLNPPCPGIRGSDVYEYVASSVQITGGSRPKYVIARELFPDVFPSTEKCEINKLLCPYEKKVLHDTIQKEAMWWIDKDAASVRSLSCTGLASGKLAGIRQPCTKCSNLRSLPSFRTAIISKGAKRSENQKFTPKSLSSATFRDLVVQDDLSHKMASYSRELTELFNSYKEEKNPHYYWLSAAEMGLAKEFDDSPVVIGLLQWIVALKEKEKRGVGKQNMPFSSSLDDFISALTTVSQKASELFQEHFCRRSKRRASNFSSSNQNPLMALIAVSSGQDQGISDLIDNGEREKNITEDDSIDEDSSATSNIDQREVKWELHCAQHPLEVISCPGLEMGPFVAAARQVIGGSRPRHVIANELFPHCFHEGKAAISSSLTLEEKYLLMDTMHKEAQWRVDKFGKCVRSLKCLGQCIRKNDACESCTALKRSANLRSAESKARRQQKNPNNIRFIPNRFTATDPYLHKMKKNSILRNLVLKSKEFVDSNLDAPFWIKLARFGITGTFRAYPVFEGVIENLVDSKDKARRGVGKQNMTYSPALDEFMQKMMEISPQALELFSERICGRSSKSLTKKRKLSQIDPLLLNSNSDVMPMPMPAILMYDNQDDDRLLSLNDVGLMHPHSNSFTQELLVSDAELQSNVMQL